ncbi:flagellar basal-body rod protein FlgG [Thermovirga lienii]|uniref:flagellar basal-body rod protein FlgG n=1 Tax=Thermovirga lienii TaxID=336261 RepID=UPI000EBD4314|nr:flagellar basal-body rod protein FlgG [Thermovirga lienii]
MIRALWSSATGMKAQQTNLDVVANNLANVNTTGFKKQRADFEDLMYQVDREPGAPVDPGSTVPTGVQIGLGSRVVGTPRLMSQGAVKITDNPLDLMISGDGFFQVTLPDGSVAYTRNGAFKVDGEGQIVTTDGYLLEPAITIPEDAEEIMISENGVVSVKVQGDPQGQEIGQIELARFINPAGLLAKGNSLFVETDASGPPIVGNPGEEGLGSLVQGALEMSNVQVVDEMVNMIEVQRAYEASSKAVQTADDLLAIANSMKKG